MPEPVHLQVLDAACALASQAWTFRVRDLVLALPHLNRATVRTHVASRCCVNAPANHQSRYRYFRALHRGLYQVEPEHRPRSARKKPPTPSQEALLASVKSGVDMTLIEEALRTTPTERLELMRHAAISLESMRVR